MVFGRRCPVCLRPGAAPCARCIERFDEAGEVQAPPGCDDLVALVRYEGAGRELVRAIKYRGHRDALDWVTGALALQLPALDSDAVVAWVPASVASRRRNGFDHAEKLARRLARQIGRPARRLLYRTSRESQVGRSAADRRGGVELTASVRAPNTVLLVDDVVTTGASIASAARALRLRGTSTAIAAVVAATPERVGVAAGHESGAH